MNNRISIYEAGWLSDLVRWGIAEKAEAREAMNRVAQAAVDELQRRRKERRQAWRKKRDD